MIALLGENGAGKSTLVKLLLRFYDADPGSSEEVSTQNSSSYRPPGITSPISTGKEQMSKNRRFAKNILEAIRKRSVIGIRAGTRPHRFIAIWAVVVEGRVFVRSWSIKARSWYRAFLEEPRGTITVGNRKIAVRAVRTRSERSKTAVDRAYKKKYNTSGSLLFVRGFRLKKRRDTTTELVPR